MGSWCRRDAATLGVVHGAGKDVEVSPYADRYRLAIALKRPAPGPYDVGDVMATEPTATPASTAIITDPSTWRASLEAFADTVRAAKTLVIGTGVLGLIIGGIVGYNMGKKR